ncbi:MAG TPA: hypothetical protein VIF10_04975 [Methylobacter sp.]
MTRSLQTKSFYQAPYQGKICCGFAMSTLRDEKAIWKEPFPS